MTIEDKSGFSDWDTYEPKPRPTPPDLQAKQMVGDWVWKCPMTGTLIYGVNGDYLVKIADNTCIKMSAEMFESSYKLKS